MTHPSSLLAFELDGRSFGVRLELVERTYRAVEITPLPGAPAVVLGIIDIHGTILPVMNVRFRFSMPGRELSAGDTLIVAWAGLRRVVLAVDRVLGVVLIPPGAEVPPDGIVHGISAVEGVVRLDGGLLLIQDLAAFLSLDEEEKLDQALQESGHVQG